MSDENPQPSREDHSSLDRAVVGGVAWTGSAKLATQVLTWASVVVAGRMLSLTDFGLMDMATSITVIAGVLAESGIGTAVLQMQELEAAVLRQMNAVSLLFSSAMFAVLALGAPWAAVFYEEPALTTLIRVAGLGFFITAVQAIPQAMLQRDLAYRKLALAEAVQAVLQAVMTIVGAVAGWSYWTFLIAALCGRSASAGLTLWWKFTGYAVPQWSTISTPLWFGLHTAATRIMWVAYTQADTFIVGKLLGTETLGVYRMALNLANAPLEKISTLVIRVSGPLFARLQNNLVTTRRYFLLISEVLFLIMGPVMVGLVLVSDDVILYILGSKWIAAGPPLRWVSIAVLPQLLAFLVTQVLMAQRMTRFLMIRTAVISVLMPLAFFFSAPYGIGAVGSVWLFMTPVILLPTGWRIYNILSLNVQQLMTAFKPSLVGTAVMAAAVLLARWLIPETWALGTRLSLSILVGVMAYMLILVSLFRTRIKQYYQFSQQMRRGGPLPAEQ